MKRKIAAMVLSTLMVIPGLVFNVNAEEENTDFSGVTIELAERYTGNASVVFNELVDEFEEESGCTVNVTEDGNDYENNMKTRMASGELPDIFQTHGWSILRYKEYLLNLSDEPWVSDYDESALGVISDDDGSIYVLMTSEGVLGTLVNMDVCEDAGVDPYEIQTWDDFGEACAKIKEAGYTPIGNITNPGLLANVAGTWVSYEGEMAEDSEKMLDGSWDWDSYRPVLEKYAEWIEAGYFYDDIMTMNDTDLAQRFAENKAAFQIGNEPSFLMTCLELNPDGNYVMLPSFASQEGGKLFVGIGEQDTFGIWKDSENIDACKAFLEFMARPENAVRLNQATGSLTCLTSGMDQDDGYALNIFKDMQEKYADADVLYENLWDREYMPSGMWQIFGNAMNMLLDDYSEDGIDETLQYLLENYQDLYDIALG